MTKASNTIDADDEAAVTARYREIQTAKAEKAAEEAEQATEERKVLYAPLIELVDSERFKAMREDTAGLLSHFTGQRTLCNGLDALVQLLDMIANQVPADARASAEPSA